MHTAIVSYLLKYFYSFSAAELNNIESEDEVFVQEFSCEESDYGDSDDEDIEQLYTWEAKEQLFSFKMKVPFTSNNVFFIQ